jgi:hypothetical protein
MEKKKLEKLSPKREVIVNLSDYEMNNLKGRGTPSITASSLPCVNAVLSFTSAVLSILSELMCDHEYGDGGGYVTDCEASEYYAPGYDNVGMDCVLSGVWFMDKIIA